MTKFKESMDRLIREEIACGRVKGAACRVIQHGKTIYDTVQGMADAEKGQELRADTIYRLFSMTKPITAVATMILFERGLIDLRDPVSKYLPEFGGQKVWQDGKEVAAYRDSTLYDLLNMTSGIPYPNDMNESGIRMDKLFRELIARREQGETVTTREYMKRIAEIPLVFQPGEKWMYGLSADILGGVIEVVSGMPYGAFLQKEIFEPLDMADTGFYVPEEKKHRFAQIYYFDGAKQELLPYMGSHLGEYYGADVAFESGGCGLVSTVEDYSHFAQMLVSGGSFNGRRILGRKTVAFMARNHLREDQREQFNWDSLWGYGYGCLMRVLMNQGAAQSNVSAGEFGWDGWTGNYVMMDPEEDLVMLYFMQRTDSGTTPVVRKLRNVIYGALE